MASVIPQSPAFQFGNELIEPKRADGLYMIGDYNMVGLEDSFQTGIFVMNQLLGREGNVSAVG